MTIPFYNPIVPNTASNGDQLPPVHLWNPPLSGSIDIKVNTEGRWFYQDSLIQRQQLVDLYCSILKYEDDTIFLVTPTEKYQIDVAAAPLLIIDWDCLDAGKHTQIIRFKTQQGQWLELNKDHKLKLISHHSQQIPIVHVRDNLYAIIGRNIYYQLVDLIETDPIKPEIMGLRSHNNFFHLT